MTKTTLKAAIIAGLTALVILGCFAGAGAATEEVNLSFENGTVVYTLNGIDWIPYNNTAGALAVINATSKVDAPVDSYLFNITYMNDTTKFLPVFNQVDGWDQINVNSKETDTTGKILIDSAVIVDGKNVSLNDLLFNMSIIPNEANVTYTAGHMEPYVIFINGTDSFVGYDAEDNKIANFDKYNITGKYQFNILPDPYYNYTVYGTRYYDNNFTAGQTAAIAYIYKEDGYNNNGNVIIATNISKAYENETKQYYKLFNLTWADNKAATALTGGEKVWNITIADVSADIALTTKITEEKDDYAGFHAGNLTLKAIDWSSANASNFKAAVTSFDTDAKSAIQWNMANVSVSFFNITFGPKGYNASGFEYNDSVLGEWNTSVALPRLVSHDNYTNCKDVWWNVSNASKITAYYGAQKVSPTLNDDGTYNFSFSTGEYIVLNLTNGYNFNITNVSNTVAGNEQFSIKIEGFPLGDVNFDETVNIVDSAVIGVMIGKEVTYDKDAGTADLNGLEPANNMTAAITYITSDIDKSGALDEVATTVNDLRLINKYLIGTADADGTAI